MRRLPPGWSPARLEDIVDVIRRRLNPQKAPEMRFLGMENVEPHTMRILGTVPASTVRSSATHFQPGDVLYGRLRPYLNKVVQPDFEGLASAEFIPLTPCAGVQPAFVRLRLNAADFVAFASGLNEGDRPRVDWDGIRQFELFVPPTGEQLRIVEAIDSYLTRIDAAVASLEAAQRKLTAYRASVLKAAVEGRLVPSEAELARKEGRSYEPANVLLDRILKERRHRWEEAELAKMRAAGKTPKDDRWKAKYEEPECADIDSLPELPEGWSWATVDQLGEVTGGLTKNATRDSGPRRYSYLRVANVYANRLDLREVKEIAVNDNELPRFLLQRGDLLVVEGNGSVDQIGRVALWDGSIEPIVHQNHLIKVRFSRAPIERWVMTWLLSPDGRAVIQRAASSTSGLHTLSISKVQSLPVPLPPQNEQTRVLDIVDQLLSIADASTDTVDAGMRRCARLRQSILKWAFEGKLVDQDPDDGPADVLLARVRAERATRAPASSNAKRARRLKAAS